MSDSRERFELACALEGLFWGSKIDPKVAVAIADAAEKQALERAAVAAEEAGAHPVHVAAIRALIEGTK